jgi:hypothetical protein
MPRISKKGGAGMIGGVRSPMATPNHGLVNHTKMNPSGITGVAKTKTLSTGTDIRSPYQKKNIV